MVLGGIIDGGQRRLKIRDGDANAGPWSGWLVKNEVRKIGIGRQ